MLEKLKKLVEEAQKRGMRSVDASVFNSPLAEQTDWYPLKGGGANFQTHRLDTSQPDLLVFKASKGAYWFTGLFGFFGLLGLVIPLAIYFSQGQQDWGLLLFAVLFGGIFLAVSILMFYFMTVPRVFDTFYGHYYQARKKPQHTMSTATKNRLVDLSDVKAIQVIAERLSSKNGSYHSYEINLVLADASRINVIDHGKHQAVIEDAETLATTLGVPLWDAT